MIQLDYDTTINFTIFENQYNTKPIKHAKALYSQFLTAISKPKIGAKNSNNSFVGGVVTPKRNNENVKSRSLITLDYDDIPHDIEHLFDHISSKFEYAFAMYSTHNHSDFNHKFRVVIPLNQELVISDQKYKRLVEYITSVMLDTPFVDPASFVLSQIMHFPTCTNIDNYFFDYVDEQLLDPTPILDNLPDDTEVKVRPTEEWIDILNGISEGGRNIAAAQLAGHLLSHNIHPNIAYEVLVMWNSRNVPPLDDKELDRTFDSILKKEVRQRELYSF